MNGVLLVLRIVLGLLFVGHGTQKLFGWFGGHGLNGTAGFFASLRYRPPRLAAVGAGGSEAIGGLFLALGFLAPLAAAMITGAMVNAIVSVHWSHGPWVTNGV
jgi:putative oxidoreductase